MGIGSLHIRGEALARTCGHFSGHRQTPKGQEWAVIAVQPVLALETCQFGVFSVARSGAPLPAAPQRVPVELDRSDGISEVSRRISPNRFPPRGDQLRLRRRARRCETTATTVPENCLGARRAVAPQSGKARMSHVGTAGSMRSRNGLTVDSGSVRGMVTTKRVSPGRRSYSTEPDMPSARARTIDRPSPTESLTAVF